MAGTTPFDEDQGISRGGGSVTRAPELAGDNAGGGGGSDCVNGSAWDVEGGGEVEVGEEEHGDMCSLPRRPLHC